MKVLPGFAILGTLLGLIGLSSEVDAQVLPGSLGFSIAGSFVNGTAQSSKSILLADNDLTNGYVSGFDLADAPASLNPSGAAGSAAFQWGEAATNSDYPHTSALWFQPIKSNNIAPEQSFELAYLYYRNGTIKTTTGATSVDIAMQVSFTQPLGLDPVSAVFGSNLINSVNNNDPVASADIVSLADQAKPIAFTDSFGNQYYLELTFQVDQTTIDGTLSTEKEFRVFEGGQGRATLLGRFTTNPIGPAGDTLMVPEPSSALLGALGILVLMRRRR
jgi:hypothetical protein